MHDAGLQLQLAVPSKLTKAHKTVNSIVRIVFKYTNVKVVYSEQITNVEITIPIWQSFMLLI